MIKGSGGTIIVPDFGTTIGLHLVFVVSTLIVINLTRCVTNINLCIDPEIGAQKYDAYI